MRKTIGQIEAFDYIQESPSPLQISTSLAREPLILSQRANLDSKPQLYFGLKDQSYDYAAKSNSTSRKLRGYIIPIISPQSKFLLLWNIIIQMGILYNFFMGPLVASYTYDAYHFDMKTPTGIGINITILILLYLDILVRFHVCFYHREKLVCNRREIWNRYFQLRFWMDLVSVVCLTVYVVGGSYQLCDVRLAIYLKFLTLIDIDNCILQNISVAKTLILFYRLIRIVVLIWLMATWAASIFFSIDYRFYIDHNNKYTKMQQLWLTNSQAVQNLDIIVNFPQWYKWYLYSLYWSIQTSCTTGYGDLTARNPPEIMYSNFVMLLMTVLFAYFINEVWSIINELQEEWQHNQNWHELNIYLKSVNLPKWKKDMISTYMMEIFQDDKQVEVENFISKHVSQQIRDEFYYELRREFFQLPLFSFLAHNQDLLSKLVYVLDECRQGQNEYIYQLGQVDYALYYMRSGSVKLENKFSGFGQQVESKEIFGLEGFLTLGRRFHSAKAQTFVRMWKLVETKFRDFLKSYPLVYEDYQLIMEQVLLYNNTTQIPDKICWGCKSKNHFIQECKVICYQNNKSQELTDLLHREEAMPRQAYKRRIIKYKKYVKKYRVEEHTIKDVIRNFKKYHPEYNLTMIVEP